MVWLTLIIYFSIMCRKNHLFWSKVWRKPIASLHRLTQDALTLDVQNLRHAAGDPPSLWKNIFTCFDPPKKVKLQKRKPYRKSSNWRYINNTSTFSTIWSTHTFNCQKYPMAHSIKVNVQIFFPTKLKVIIQSDLKCTMTFGNWFWHFIVGNRSIVLNFYQQRPVFA